MPTGLKIPVGVDKSGGAAIETNESAQTKKLLLLALSENDDDNPFQDVGIDEDLIFQVKSPGTRARAERKINRVLERFFDRIRLAPDTPIQFKEDAEGEIEISFSYVDLLTNKTEEFQATFVR